MKGRIFIAIMGIAVMLSSVTAMAQNQYTVTQKYDNTVTRDIDNSEIGNFKMVYVPTEGAATAGGDQQNIVDINCVHNHGLVQIMNAALPFYQTYAAMDIYNNEIEADKNVELAKWQGYYDVSSIYATAYASDPIYAMIQNGGGGMGGYGGYGSNGGMYGMTNYYGSIMAGNQNPRWN